MAGVIYILIGDNTATFTLAQHMFLHVNCRNNNHLSNLQTKKTQNRVESGRKKNQDRSYEGNMADGIHILYFNMIRWSDNIISLNWDEYFNHDNYLPKC